MNSALNGPTVGFSMKHGNHDLPWPDESLIWFSIHKDLWLICFFKKGVRVPIGSQWDAKNYSSCKAIFASVNKTDASKMHPFLKMYLRSETNGCQLSNGIKLFFACCMFIHAVTEFSTGKVHVNQKKNAPTRNDCDLLNTFQSISTTHSISRPTLFWWTTPCYKVWLGSTNY